MSYTFTDDRGFPKPTPGFKPVDPEQKRMWEKLAGIMKPAQKTGFVRYTADDLRKIYARNIVEPTSEAAE